MNDFTAETTKEAIDAYMRKLFSLRADEARAIGERYHKLWRTIEEVTMTGGKRVRPYLAVVGYGALDDAIIPVAAAQECIHIAMLMHDDVIDQDFVRRGHDNINGTYRKNYHAYLTEPLRTHYANSVGILAGDALLSEAYRMIASSPFDENIKTKVTHRAGASVFEVIGGELLDVEAAFVDDEEFDPMTIYRYKTASYSFVGPLLAGAYCRGRDSQTVATLQKFAIDLGIGFQIQDDLLGVFGNEVETGKSTVADLLAGKRTLLAEHHTQALTDEMRANFQAFGNMEASTQQLETIKADMIESGARQKTIAAVDNYFTRAAASLEQITDPLLRTRLEELLASLRERRL